MACLTEEIQSFERRGRGGRGSFPPTTKGHLPSKSPVAVQRIIPTEDERTRTLEKSGEGAQATSTTEERKRFVRRLLRIHRSSAACNVVLRIPLLDVPSHPTPPHRTPPCLIRSLKLFIPFRFLFRFLCYFVSFSVVVRASFRKRKNLNENRFSPINDILDKESFTLEEILAQDEVLQEVKSLNIKLVDL